MEGMRAFLNIDGMELLDLIICSAEAKFTPRLKTKAIFLVKELLYHDESLDLPYYQGTEIKDKKIASTSNALVKPRVLTPEEFEAERQQFISFKGMVKSKMAKLRTWRALPLILSDKSNRMIDARTRLLEIMQTFVANGSCKDDLAALRKEVQDHKVALEGNPETKPDEAEMQAIHSFLC